MQLRRRNPLGILAALAAMLFLQAAYAFAACELPEGRSGMAAMHAAAMPGCHEAQAPEALCLAHCQAEDQTLGKLQPGLPDLPLPPARVHIAPAPMRAQAPMPPVVPHAGPPPRILYQSLLL